MAKTQKGVCKNYDDCSKAENKEVQEVKSGEQFICSECSKKLVEVDGKKKGKNNGLIIGIIVILLLIGGAVAVVMWQRSEATEVAIPEVNESNLEGGTSEPIPDGGANQPATNVNGDNNEEESVADELEKTAPTPTPITNGTGTLNLGYGIYTGDIKNGKPHGNGMIEYTKSQKIISSKDYMASPGEKVIGTFRDGKLNMGTWHQNDGNEVVVK